MSEVAVIAWIAALALAVVVLGFCAYEVLWKACRLQRDLARLQLVGARLLAVQSDVAAVQRRLAGTDAG